LHFGYSVLIITPLDCAHFAGSPAFTDVEGRFTMKRYALAVALIVGAGSAALAADLPPPAPPANYIPIAPPYNWSGFYIGGNLGAGFNNTDGSTDTFHSTFGTTTSTSFLGGGQVGVNYEFWSFFVIGAEVMFDALPDSKNTVNLTNGTNTAAATINNRWLTTVTGKLGYAWDRVLLYGKGGGAWVGTSSPGLTVNNVPASFTSTSNNNNFAATVGLGVEWAFADNWSARAEWDAILLPTQIFTVSGGAFGTDTITVNNRSINMFTAGVNYKFGGWW
jgi:outer membrane immunogenic protein